MRSSRDTAIGWSRQRGLAGPSITGCGAKVGSEDAQSTARRNTQPFAEVAHAHGGHDRGMKLAAPLSSPRRGRPSESGRPPGKTSRRATSSGEPTTPALLRDHAKIVFHNHVSNGVV